MLSYDALSDGVTVDELLERVLATVAEPSADRLIRRDADGNPGRLAEERVTEALLNPRPRVRARAARRRRWSRRSTSPSPGWWRGRCPGDRRAAGVGLGTELAQLRPYEIGDDVRHIDAAATARTGTPHVRLHVPERALTTWIVLDVSPSMAFGTARRLKADVAEGAALVFGRLGVRRAGSVGLIAFGAGGAPRAPAPRIQTGDRGAAPRCWREGVAPDGQHDPEALADALRRVGPAGAAAGAGGRDLGLPRSARLGATAGLAARSPLGAGGRDRRSARGRAAARWGTWR